MKDDEDLALSPEEFVDWLLEPRTIEATRKMLAQTMSVAEWLAFEASDQRTLH